ncbi:MAG: Fur family transcriptional regulator, partial [Mahellales bacterium]
PQRRATLDVILENEGRHLSTEEIYEFVKEKCPEIGLATVYRTLQLLVDIDFVYKHNFDDGKSRYELSHEDEDHHHHHLICLKCGTVIEVGMDSLEELESIVNRKYNFTITNHKVKFFGYCEKCMPKVKPTRG